MVATDGGGQTAEMAVTVKVTNVEEEGKVTLPGAQPRVGVEITAILADSDVVSEDSVTWQWYKGDPEDFVPTDDNPLTTDQVEGNAIDKATSATYTPVAKDKGSHLKAVATYFDLTYAADAEDRTTAGISDSAFDNDRFKNTATSEASIEVDANPANSTPKFREGASTERFVLENTDEDMPIGVPVLATDADDEALTYSLGGTDKDSFGIVSAITGAQIQTKAALDYETKKTYTVTVTATDGSGESSGSASITVTIKVTNEDERPTINGLYRRRDNNRPAQCEPQRGQHEHGGHLHGDRGGNPEAVRH